MFMGRRTSHGTKKGEIEPVTLPRNPLDVLAQQILSILVADEMLVDDLFANSRTRPRWIGCAN